MANLLELIVELATDADARRTFRADPAAGLAGAGTGLTGEDVEAAARVAALQVGPPVAEYVRTDDVEGTGRDEDPTDAAVRHLLALCEHIDRGEAHVLDAPRPVQLADFRDPEPEPELAEAEAHADGAEPSDPGSAVPDHPPGLRTTRLWAVSGQGEADGDGPAVDPDHPANGGATTGMPPLVSVPEPEGGFEFSPLELVVLTDGLPDAGIEAGATATVVAVHREDGELAYEVEVSDDEGGRRFLGIVPPSALDRM